MKKVVFLLAFVLIGLTFLFAEEQFKKFDIGDGGIVKIRSLGGSFDVKIIYDKVENAPAMVRENIESNKYGKMPRNASSRFSVKFLDDNGREVSKQEPFFTDFTLEDTEKGSIIVLKYQAQGYSKNIYDRIASVAVDYGR
jgi:hypothetical protein